jgi:hypothetical protein
MRCLFTGRTRLLLPRRLPSSSLISTNRISPLI